MLKRKSEMKRESLWTVSSEEVRAQSSFDLVDTAPVYCLLLLLGSETDLIITDY